MFPWPEQIVNVKQLRVAEQYFDSFKNIGKMFIDDDVETL